jgi:invasion protein IalB
MKRLNKYGIAAFVVLIAGLGVASTYALGKTTSAPATAAAKPAAAAPASKAADANAVVDDGWNERCVSKDKKADKKNCEVFTRLEMKTSNMRVAEVAIGFPQDKTLPAGTARGVIILPLGVMLEPGATMSIDTGKPFGFKSRFCTQSGCFSFVNLNKDIINSMKTGKDLNVFFKTADNRDAHLTMGLGSFGKALNKIE